jgi:hypothetical protein
LQGIRGKIAVRQHELDTWAKVPLFASFNCSTA